MYVLDKELWGWTYTAVPVWFCSVVVIMCFLHAEGSGFYSLEPSGVLVQPLIALFIFSE